jgi:hypothetical protein
LIKESNQRKSSLSNASSRKAHAPLAGQAACPPGRIDVDLKEFIAFLKSNYRSWKSENGGWMALFPTYLR